MLNPRDYAILEVLSEDGGFLTSWVSKAIPISYCDDNARMRSAAVRSWLLRLKDQGLVDYLDNQKPVCWKRTKLGTKALENRACNPSENPHN
jgi:hypothetical protein